MNEIDKLIEITYKLCRSLETMAENERKFGIDVCYKLDQLSGSISKHAEELTYISDYLGGVS